MRLRYTRRALGQIEAITRYIEDENTTAARDVARRIRIAAERLLAFPFIGRAGADRGSREWVVRGLPCVIVYEVDEHEEEVIIVAVFHGAQDRRPA